MDEKPRIVITGMGIVSPIAIGCNEFFAHLIAGKSGIDRISLFDPSNQLCQIAAEVKNFNPDDFLDRKSQKRTGRYLQFSIIAADEAVKQSGLDFSKEDLNRTATVVSSAIGDFPMMEEQIKVFFERGPGKMNPFTVPRASANMASGLLSIKYGIAGPGFGITSACTTGNHSIAAAYLLLKAGLADVALAGGVESAICSTFVESYIVMRALSTRNDEPARASRPFDKDRDGFVIGEGAGVLVMETLEHAEKRGAKILAELAGIGMTGDAYHIAAPHPEGQGAAKAMEQALNDANLAPGDIDYINAHGTSTQMNDITETKAIKNVFGQKAYDIPVTSTKSMIGHCIGAAGAIEAIATILTLNNNLIPPTINLENPDHECDLDYVPINARKKELNYAISNSFGFGGQNCVLLFKKV
jgi:3-oxoacyl-[acyl-carrier-protein] synthase II